MLSVFMFYLLLASTASFVVAGLTTDSSSEYYYGAIVTFNYTENGLNISQGSQSSTDEEGNYGAHSPVREVTGVVVHALSTTTGIRDGCTFNYNNVYTPQPWVALVSRGNCSFADKITNAAQANASGIIVYDYQDSTGVTIMSHENSQKIVAIIIKFNLGTSIARVVDGGTQTIARINPGGKHHQPGFRLEKTSIIFVAVSFMILMLVSLAWLVFYYIQRFRLFQAQSRGQRQRQSMTRKAMAKLTTRTLKSGDTALSGDVMCAVCIENYKINDVIRKLPCGHLYHKKCVDPWLESKQTCPMCKVNVIKTLAAGDVTRRASSSSGHSVSGITNQTDIEMEETAEAMPSTEQPISTSQDEPHFSGSNPALNRSDEEPSVDESSGIKV
uniref:RING finger protein 150 n=1 Tax=Phallusia mammillata TaxID=59560 RepID=A0A6F9DQB6_9ASCI|nr:RING finger protein 150 [Phallusia mammillata]